nr:androgen-induced gene 1 protein isoform X1 [Gorilla gorilla gorilla]
MALVPCQVLRMAILLSYCSILCNYKAIEMPSHQTYGGSWKFLTFIDLVIQAVFFGICVLTDLSSLLTRGSGNQEQERQLKKLISLRDWMLAVLAFPVGVFVVAVFWIIYAYDREMIYPKLLDNFIPGWLNHGMHTTVLPFILIEMRTSHHQYPSRSSGLTAICTFSVGYILWVCWVHHVTGMWVYPFLEHIGPGARIVFFGSTTILMNFLYLLGEVLNNYIWDTQKSCAFGSAAIWQYESLKSRVQSYFDGIKADWLDSIRPQKEGDFRKEINKRWNNLSDGQRTQVFFKLINHKSRSPFRHSIPPCPQLLCCLQGPIQIRSILWMLWRSLILTLTPLRYPRRKSGAWMAGQLRVASPFTQLSFFFPLPCEEGHVCFPFYHDCKFPEASPATLNCESLKPLAFINYPVSSVSLLAA